MEYKDLYIRIPKFPLKKRFPTWLLPTPGNALLTLLIVFILFWAQARGVFARFLVGEASTVSVFAYQGRLADESGTPLTGNYKMLFKLYNTATGGQHLWEEKWDGSNSVAVSDGLFNVMLGSLTPIPNNLVKSNNNLWLGVSVEDDFEMQPRVQLGSVPFAVQALTVPDDSITTANIQNGAVTLEKLGEQPYYFSGSFATPTEWMADVIFNGNYARFCEAIGRTFVHADTLQAHFTDNYWDNGEMGQGNGYIYNGWYYVGPRYGITDIHYAGETDPNNPHSIWKYNGTESVSRKGWSFVRSAIIWCK